MYQYMEYSESRGTWNIIGEDGEWLFEGTYEQCCHMMDCAYDDDDPCLDWRGYAESEDD